MVMGRGRRTSLQEESESCLQIQKICQKKDLERGQEGSETVTSDAPRQGDDRGPGLEVGQVEIEIGPLDRPGGGVEADRGIVMGEIERVRGLVEVPVPHRRKSCQNHIV